MEPRPNGYSFLNCGHCLGGVVPDGSFLEVDPSRGIEIGDIVVVVFRPGGPFSRFAESLGVAGLLGVTKIFLGSEETDSGERVYRVGQLNPPIVSPVPAKELEAMHLVTGGDVPDGVIEAMNDEDSRAIKLLGPFFCGSGNQAPVNPAWRPPGGEA